MLLFVVSTAVLSCLKETIEKEMPNKSMSQSVWYKNHHCWIGEVAGLECIAVNDNDDCSEQKDCQANGTMPNYNRVLNEMFTVDEIDFRTDNGTRITEPELIEALRDDGYPVN